MKIKDKIDRYLNDSDYKITYFNNQLNVNNYEEIIDFFCVLIKIKHNDGISIISGNNLTVSKMIDNEVLIEGKIDSIKLS